MDSFEQSIENQEEFSQEPIEIETPDGKKVNIHWFKKDAEPNSSNGENVNIQVKFQAM